MLNDRDTYEDEYDDAYDEYDDDAYDEYDEYDIADGEAYHEDLAELLMTLVEEEHQAIRSLDLERYTGLAQRRAQVCEQVIALAQEIDVPRTARVQYQRAHTLAQGNAQLLQDVHQVVRSIILRLTTMPKTSTYSRKGQARPPVATASGGMMIWKG